MKVGDVVYNEYHKIRRYGVVTNIYVKEDQGIPIPWSYAQVKWFSDEAYEHCVKKTDKLRNKSGESKTIRLEEYRVDKIRTIDLNKELSTLNQIKQYQENLKSS
tara:strand:- start:9478 stop:9789 length:312 start_codon:yes stop_codon:yes gene_type:complete